MFCCEKMWLYKISKSVNSVCIYISYSVPAFVEMGLNTK